MLGQNVCLTVVFNHRFDRNLEVLDRIYRDRFGPPLYIVPFYDGPRPDVIPVFENSIQFQGYFAQAYSRLAERNADFYVIVADDILLHPSLDSISLLRHLEIEADCGYIKELTPLAKVPPWPNAIQSIRAFEKTRFVDPDLWLPPPAEAQSLIARHGIHPEKIDVKTLLQTAWRYHRSDLRSTLRTIRHYLKRPAYPMLAGYSDFFILPAKSLRPFCRLCGIFAAMRLWVETAIPTAMAMTCDRVIVEKDTDWRGVELWEPTEVDALMNTAQFDLAKLAEGFAPRQLYLHPVKLSKFKNTTV